MENISEKESSLQRESREDALKRIAGIPVDELLNDFHEASKDLQAAEIACAAGRTEYRYRIDGNKKQLQVIQGEIKRRIEWADDLLAACKSALERSTGWSDDLSSFNSGQPRGSETERAIRAAIAKAEGSAQ